TNKPATTVLNRFSSIKHNPMSLRQRLRDTYQKEREEELLSSLPTVTYDYLSSRHHRLQKDSNQKNTTVRVYTTEGALSTSVSPTVDSFEVSWLEFPPYLPKLTSLGYSCSPSLKELAKLSEDDIKRVDKFTVS